MIKLDRNFTPLCLAPDVANNLASKFKVDGASVWNFPELKRVLLETSNGKCAYCECKVNEESKYMEVEHFEDKCSNPDKVVDWDNLLPSCKRCNASKGTHNVIVEPIINPYKVDPKLHLGFKLYRIRALSDVGQNTIDVLALNDFDRVITKRIEVGEIIQSSIDDAVNLTRQYEENANTRNRNRLLAKVRAILCECIECSAYSATAATVLHNDPDYGFLKTKMNSLGVWNSELQDYDIKSSVLALQYL